MTGTEDGKRRIFIPERVARERECPSKPPKGRTPICPACGSKFAHDNQMNECKICGLPDEIADLGPQVIARWKRKHYHPNSSKRGKKQIRAMEGASASRKRNKHGRKGVPKR